MESEAVKNPQGVGRKKITSDKIKEKGNDKKIEEIGKIIEHSRTKKEKVDWKEIFDKYGISRATYFRYKKILKIK